MKRMIIISLILLISFTFSNLIFAKKAKGEKAPIKEEVKVEVKAETNTSVEAEAPAKEETKAPVKEEAKAPVVDWHAWTRYVIRHNAKGSQGLNNEFTDWTFGNYIGNRPTNYLEFNINARFSDELDAHFAFTAAWANNEAFSFNTFTGNGNTSLNLYRGWLNYSPKAVDGLFVRIGTDWAEFAEHPNYANMFVIADGPEAREDFNGLSIGYAKDMFDFKLGYGVYFPAFSNDPFGSTIYEQLMAKANFKIAKEFEAGLFYILKEGEQYFNGFVNSSFAGNAAWGYRLTNIHKIGLKISGEVDLGMMALKYFVAGNYYIASEENTMRVNLNHISIAPNVTLAFNFGLNINLFGWITLYSSLKSPILTTLPASVMSSKYGVSADYKLVDMLVVGFRWDSIDPSDKAITGADNWNMLTPYIHFILNQNLSAKLKVCYLFSELYNDKTVAYDSRERFDIRLETYISF